jgi:hypothetical protein
MAATTTATAIQKMGVRRTRRTMAFLLFGLSANTADHLHPRVPAPAPTRLLESPKFTAAKPGHVRGAAFGRPLCPQHLDLVALLAEWAATEVRVLREERDIPKRAMAFFAR